MKQKSQEELSTPCRYENAAGPDWAEEESSPVPDPVRLAKPSRQAKTVEQSRAVNGGPVQGSLANGRGGTDFSYLGQNLNVRPYAITLYPFMAQVC
jgi:hypothetical protein